MTLTVTTSDVTVSITPICWDAVVLDGSLTLVRMLDEEKAPYLNTCM